MTERLLHSHTQTLLRITRLLAPRCALFRSSRLPHIVLPGLLGLQGLKSGLSPGGKRLGFGRKGRRFGARPPAPGSPPPGTFGGVWIISSPQGGGRGRRLPASRPPPRRRRPAAAPQYEVVLAARGRGAAAAAAAALGALREPPGAARRTRFPGARPGLGASLLQPRGRGWDTKILCGQ